MKNLKYLLGCTALAVISFVAAGCNDDDELFLKRDTDAMTFSYLNTTKELSVLSNGYWEVSSADSWISISPESGTGNGIDRQIVEVTVSHNPDASRQGTIRLKNSEKDLEISVSQDDGIFSWGKGSMSGTLALDVVSSGRITIRYNKGGNNDAADLSATLEGPGSEGLSVAPINNYKLVPGDGTIELIIDGTPENFGAITATVQAKLTSRNVSATIPVEGNVKEFVDEKDRMPTPVVTAFKLLPRLAVLDWGKYERNSGESRKFTIELAETRYGDPIRRYHNQADWLASASVGTGSYFYENNRFAVGDLKPGTTYWFRLIYRSTDTNKYLDSNVAYFEFTTPAEEVLDSNVLIYKDFDNFWWGGCPIYQAFAVMPTEAQIKANLDPTSDIVKGTDYRTYYPVGNIANPWGGALNATNCPKMWEYYWDGKTYGSNTSSPDFAGWMGSNALPCTGSVRLATASADGWLRTPKLSAIGSGTANITVTVNTTPYFEAYHSWGEDYLRHLIIVSGGGTITGGGSTLKETSEDKLQATVECTSNVNSSVTMGKPSGTHAAPTEHTINITGATKDTQITVRTAPYTTGSSHYRIWLDDIKVVKN